MLSKESEFSEKIKRIQMEHEEKLQSEMLSKESEFSEQLKKV